MNRKNHSVVFLMEMIAVSFFFILCAAICIQIFVKAEQLSSKASNLTQGVLIAQSVAEVWKAEGTGGLQKQFKAIREEEKTEHYHMGFDDSGNPCDRNAVFRVDVDLTVPLQLAILVKRGKQKVYQLYVSRQETYN